MEWCEIIQFFQIIITIMIVICLFIINNIHKQLIELFNINFKKIDFINEKIEKLKKENKWKN